MKKTLLNMVMALGAVAMITACGGNSDTPATETPTETTTEAPTTTGGENTTNFAFGNIENAELDTAYTTNTVTMSGITEPVLVKTNNGTLVVNGVNTDVTEYSVNAGDTVAVRVISSGSYGSTVTTKVEAGGQVDFFGVTTKADTATPPVTPPTTPISTPTISMANQSVNDNGGGLPTDLPAPTVTGVNAGAVYSIVTGTTGLTINSSTGVMTYNNNLTGNQNFSITIKVTNTDGGTNSTTFTLSVTDNA